MSWPSTLCVEWTATGHRLGSNVATTIQQAFARGSDDDHGDRDVLNASRADVTKLTAAADRSSRRNASMTGTVAFGSSSVSSATPGAAWGCVKGLDTLR